jgi:hypothetical protein
MAKVGNGNCLTGNVSLSKDKSGGKIERVNRALYELPIFTTEPAYYFILLLQMETVPKFS